MSISVESLADDVNLSAGARDRSAFGTTERSAPLVVLRFRREVDMTGDIGADQANGVHGGDDRWETGLVLCASCEPRQDLYR